MGDGHIRRHDVMDSRTKNKLAQLRHWRIRKKVIGTTVRPRMSVRFSNTHIYVQFIDDSKSVTLAGASTRGKDMPDRATLKANVVSAAKIGALAAQAAVSKGIKRVVFDRSGARFHGKVKALADAARQNGLEF
jgi:large subunit ribosomal protein L18